ncbi:MAG TPA: hypothetical protein VGO76_15120 [Luteibacter sp.]|jgi:hypothetical protein|nr:hypothetical protein [Luteibacter sp.]
MSKAPDMRDLRTSELLDIWDAGLRALPMRRAWLLLRDAFPGQAVERWSLGQVNAGLLRLRQRWFGNDWPCLANCPACGEINEVQLQVDALFGDSESPGAPATPVDQRIQLDAWTVDFRLPCMADLLAIGEVGGTGNDLLDRVVAGVTRGGALVAVTELPASALQSIGSQVDAADPLASIELSLACPVCSKAWQEPLLVIDVFWSELSALAERLLSEVGRLAQGFGWSEADILAMSAQRRQRYLTWLGA